MTDMLHLNQKEDMSRAKATVDIDPLLSIIMQSDMAKAFPDRAAAIVNKCRGKASSETRNGVAGNRLCNI